MNNYSKFLSRSKYDEKYTPRYAVLPIIKYLPKDKVIWCPFDTKNSEFVIALKENGFEVVHSHIATGQDFSIISLNIGILSFQIRLSAIRKKYSVIA
jgi:hypothetical protein